MTTQTEELVLLASQLREVEQRIVEVSGGSVDAVVDSEGKPYLLRRAQQELRERIELQRRFSEQQSAILDALPAHIALLDSRGTIVAINQAWRQFGAENGATDGQHGVGSNYLSVCEQSPGVAGEASEAAEGIRTVLGGRSDHFSLEYPCHAPDRQRWFSLIAAPLRSRQQSGAVVMHIDITQRKLAEMNLQRVASLFRASNDGVLIIEPDGVIRDVNPAYTLISGFNSEELLGKPAAMHPRLNAPGLDREIDESIKSQGYWTGELRARRKNGEVYEQKVSVSAIKDDVGGVLNYIIIISDITRLKEHAAELQRVAHYDALTGLPNRRLLTDRLEQAIRHARRHEEVLAVCYLDLDNFKPINDRWGHSAGDRVLVSVARRLEGALRESDTISRLGGDEFVLLLPGIEGGDELDLVLGRVMETLHTPFEIEGETPTVSASAGVALFPEDSEDADTLLRYADQAMYGAKASGRDRYLRFDRSEARRSEERQSQLQIIINGLQRQEFIFYYQPKVDLRDGRLVGVEALVRWQHPEHGLLSPDRFLGFVIGSEVEVRFGQYVLDSVLEQLSAWQQQGIVLQASINVSGNELRQPGLADRIAARLARYTNLSPSQLELEVVETAAVQDINQVLLTLSQCRDAGLQVALDDFGTGYSSLTVLRQLPIDTLKIDQSFVRDMLEDSNDRSIVDSVIHMARAFNRNVVAEGVETMEHAAALMAMGCFQAQGYGIARPMPADAVAAWLEDWQQTRLWETIEQ
ncbi:MAG: EAL domain-containing protein [Pseudohongiellaceae bacterium]